MSSTGPSFTFSDLFAGIGGFHAALHAAGGQWVFASETDGDARRVYDHNWLRPLRESGAALPGGVDAFQVSGNIVHHTEPKVTVPHSDVLAAGFPCQPFSKSGFQRGMDETRGTLFWNIARILADKRSRPSVVMLENVRNLAGPRHRDSTLRTIVATLHELGYRTSTVPSVLSPHLLPKSRGGRPQVRERVFIMAHYVGRRAMQLSQADGPVGTPRTLVEKWGRQSWDLATDLPLEADEHVKVMEFADDYFLDGTELKWISEWDHLLRDVNNRLKEGDRLPGFPIWLQHFGDFRTVSDAETYIEREEARSGLPMPGWKRSHLLKNGGWFERFEEIIEPHWQVISGFPLSRQKFEWQAGPYVPLSKTIMHFRPSGIRCKRPDYVPALVAITQTSILGDRRRLIPQETARLQGLPDSFEFAQSPVAEDGVTCVQGEAARQRDAASYRQMGNGVNVGVAYYAFREYVKAHREEIPSHIVRTVDEAPDNPDEALLESSPRYARP